MRTRRHQAESKLNLATFSQNYPTQTSGFSSLPNSTDLLKLERDQDNHRKTRRAKPVTLPKLKFLQKDQI